MSDPLRDQAFVAPDQWTRGLSVVLPVAFSQVREDPAIDAALLAEVGPRARILMIASGGDTAVWLAAGGGARHLHLVDVNRAQLALTRLKLHLLRHHSPEERLALLGHLPMDRKARGDALVALQGELGLSRQAISSYVGLAILGPDHVGRYERLFAELREELAHPDEVRALLELGDPEEQARRVDPATALGRALDAALGKVMRLENLVALFGTEATRQARQSFAAYFAERTRHVLATQPARVNPFLAQMLLGEFLPGAAYPWLTAAPPLEWPEVEYDCRPAQEALFGAPAASLDYVHLSNILDWLEPAAASETLERARVALRPGGLLCVRQLNSTLDVPAAAPQFHWRHEQARALHAADRSFFYRALWIAAK